MFLKAGWVSIISITFSNFAVGVRRTTSNPSYQTVVHLTPPSHYHTQLFRRCRSLESLTFNDLISTRISTTEAFEKPLHEFPKNYPVFLEKFCRLLARYIVWSELTNRAPTTDWFSTPLFSRLIYMGRKWPVVRLTPHFFSIFEFDLSLFRTEYHPYLLR